MRCDRGRRPAALLTLVLLLCFAALAAGRAGPSPDVPAGVASEPASWEAAYSEPGEEPSPASEETRPLLLADALGDGDLRVTTDGGERIPLTDLTQEDGVYSLLDMEYQTVSVPGDARFSVTGVRAQRYDLEIWAEIDGVGELVDTQQESGGVFSLPGGNGTYAVNLLSGGRCYGFVAVVGDGICGNYRSAGPVPYYLDLDCAPEANFYREDWGIGWYIGGEAVEALKALELKPCEEDAGPPLEIPHAFTLSYQFGRREDVFRFDRDGVTHNGARYAPRHPEALSILYENEIVREILDAEAYRLGDRMGFGPEDVESVTVHTFETMNGEQMVRLSAREAVAGVTEMFSQALVRGRIKNSYDLCFMASGSWAVSFEFALRNGETWRFCDGPTDYFIGPDGEEEVAILSTNKYRDTQVDFWSPYDLSKLASSYTAPRPRLVLSAGESEEEVEPRAFDYGGISLKTKNYFPPVRYSLLVPAAGDERLSIRLVDFKGALVEPLSVQAFDWRQGDRGEQGEIEEFTDALPMDGSRVRLTKPETDVLIRVELPEGTMEYLVHCIVSDLPRFLFMRWDTYSGQRPQTTAARGEGLYHEVNSYSMGDALAGLELEKGNREQSLPVTVPLKIIVTKGEKRAKVVIQSDGIFCDGQRYVAAEPENIAAVYKVVDEVSCGFRRS